MNDLAGLIIRGVSDAVGTLGKPTHAASIARLAAAVW